MLHQVISRLLKFVGKAKGGQNLHAPFRVTTHRGHTVQLFKSLETALEAANIHPPSLTAISIREHRDHEAGEPSPGPSIVSSCIADGKQ